MRGRTGCSCCQGRSCHIQKEKGQWVGWNPESHNGEVGIGVDSTVCLVWRRCVAQYGAAGQLGSGSCFKPQIKSLRLLWVWVGQLPVNPGPSPQESGPDRSKSHCRLPVLGNLGHRYLQKKPGAGQGHKSSKRTFSPFLPPHPQVQVY